MVFSEAMHNIVVGSSVASCKWAYNTFHTTSKFMRAVLQFSIITINNTVFDYMTHMACKACHVHNLKGQSSHNQILLFETSV